MSNYQIITDSCCDLPKDMAAKLGLTVINLSLLFREQVLEETSDKELKTVYDAMRAGETATTSAANPDKWASVMEPVVADGNDLLVLAFSSGLSTTYQSAVITANELAEKYPDRTIRVVDTLCASMGQGLLAWYACQKRDAGMSLEDLAAWCDEAKSHLCQWFTVDDLMFLKRGGRINAATALVGTMLNIKPVLHVDDEGHLISKAKVRGRKAALEALAAKLGELGLPGENDTVFISHGDCLQDAEYVAQVLKSRYGVKEVVISYVGAVIGSHSGPGTVALFFLGQHR